MNFGLDTEDADGRPTLYGLDWRGDKKIFQAGPEGRLELVRLLSQAPSPIINIWCLNLQYDLVNLFGETFMNVVVPYCARKKIVGAKLRGTGTVRFFGIERFIPKMNLEKLGNLIGVKKKNLPFDDPRRCLRDAKIARMVGERICAVLKKIDIPLKFSPISGGLKALEADNGGELPLAPWKSMDAGKAALYGGRTEVYFKGKWDKGDLFYFDFVSAYGRAMMEELPDYSVSYDAEKPYEKFWIADVTVVTKATNGIGPLPYHNDTKNLIFPEGKFRGWWTSDDLSLSGVTIQEFHRVVNFPSRGRMLRSLVKRLLPTPFEHPISKAIKKNIYTGLSGKFAQSNDYTLFIKSENAKPQDLWSGVPFGDWVLADRKGRYPQSTNYVWSAFIQARSRIWLWELFEMIRKAGGRVLYTDTDSALAQLPSPIVARKISKLYGGRIRSIPIMEAELLSPKVYKLTKKDGSVILSTKGVPKRLVSESVVLGEDVIEGEVPDSFFTLLKSNLSEGGRLRNRWSKKKWHFTTANRNRVVLPHSPWTRPLQIQGEVISL